MEDAQRREVTRLLECVGSGDRLALERLAEVVYADLRRIADAALRGERRDHTLEPTALVHEAWLRFAAGNAGSWNDRAHFFAAAATAIRRVLVDHARARAAAKRDAGARITLSAGLAETPQGDVDLLALEEALGRLAARDPRQARVVELRFFAGLSVDEAAAVLGVAPRTVDGDWKLARAFLHRALAPAGGGEP